MNYVCKEGKLCWCLKHSQVVISAFILQWFRHHFTCTLPSHLNRQRYPQPAARMGWKTPFLLTMDTPNSFFSSPLQNQGFFSGWGCFLVCFGGFFAWFGLFFFFFKWSSWKQPAWQPCWLKSGVYPQSRNSLCRRSFLILITYMLLACFEEAPLGVKARFCF